MIHILLRVAHFDFRYNSLNRHLLAKVHDHRDDMGAQSEWKDWSTSNQPNDQSKQSKTDQKHINTCPNEQPAKIHWCICARHRWPCAPAPPLTLTTIAIMIISAATSHQMDRAVLSSSEWDFKRGIIPCLWDIDNDIDLLTFIQSNHFSASGLRTVSTCSSSMGGNFIRNVRVTGLRKLSWPLSST